MDTEARMDTDTQAFLSLFFSIEGILRRLAGGREEGFARLVARARDHNAVVRRFEQELRAFNELRNMLVHAPLTIPVARPSPEAVRALQRIYDHLTHPQLVLPRFARQVVSLTDDQPFADAIEAMHKTGYSQFPIYRGAAFQGLLTDGLMARWIAARLDHDFARLLRVPLKDVLHQVPERSTVAFVSRRATVAEVREMFESHLRQGRLRLDAVLITETGDPDQPPLGIVTPTDAIAIVAEDALPPS